jgi:hypothetical protein
VTLLSLAQAKRLAPSELSDPDMQVLLDAAEQAINLYAGPVGDVTETLTAGSGDLVMLSRPASAITSVSERLVTLEQRLPARRPSAPTAGHRGEPGQPWRGRLVITYTPEDDTDLRKAVQADLLKLELNTRTGTQSESIGAWSETFTSGDTYTAEREAILKRLLSTRLVLL